MLKCVVRGCIHTLVTLVCCAEVAFILELHAKVCCQRLHSYFSYMLKCVSQRLHSYFSYAGVLCRGCIHTLVTLVCCTEVAFIL